MTMFRLFQTDRVAANKFLYDENGKKFFKRVKNTGGKGEIARHEQFLFFPQGFQMEIAGYEQLLLFPHLFQMTCTADMEKQELVWKRVHSDLSKILSFSSEMTHSILKSFTEDDL